MSRLNLRAAFLLPLRDWPPAARKIVVGLAAVVCVGSSIFFARGLGSPYTESDAPHYMELAAGGRVPLPFASRQLAPRIVRAVSTYAHISLASAFFLLGLVCIAGFAWGVFRLIQGSGAPAWVLPAIALMFFWPRQFSGFVLPDLLYGALLVYFLVLLKRERLLLAGLMMLPLAVSRESTILTLLCLLVAGWRRLRAAEIAVAVLSLVSGMLIVRRLTVDALPNHERISPALYVFAKMPFNLLRNVFGLRMWANLYPDACGTSHVVTVRLGPLQQVGFCGVSPTLPMLSFGSALAAFGLLPAMLVFLWQSRNRHAARLDRDGSSVLLRFCMVYGVVSYVLAPLIGESFLRLFDYAWPLPLIALPLLLGGAGANFRNAASALTFVAMHLAVSWACLWMGIAFPYIGIAVFLNAAAYLLLKECWVATGDAGGAISRPEPAGEDAII